jgi:hypothetical protein
LTETSTEDPRKSYDGNDVTVEFDIVYTYDDTSDIVVVLVDVNGAETTLTEDGAGSTGYTVNTTTNRIVCNSAPATGERLVHYRDTPVTQETDLQSRRQYSNDLIEAMSDKLTRICREMLDDLARKLGFPETIESGWSFDLPTPVDGAMLGWDTANKKIVNLSEISDTITASAYMRTVLDDLTAAAARTTLNAAAGDSHTFSGDVTVTGNVACGDPSTDAHVGDRGYNDARYAAIAEQREVIQVVHLSYATVGSGSTAIPADDTIPQSNEGDEMMTLAITATASNLLYVDVVVSLANSTNISIVAALFQDSTASALAVGWDYQGANSPTIITLRHKVVAAGGATTFKVRVGAAGGTTYWNQVAAGRSYGGVAGSTMTITEVRA